MRRRTVRSVLVCLLVLLLGPGCRSSGGPFRPTHRTGPADPAPLRAGVATVELTPETGHPLGGYGTGARRQEWPFLWGGGLLGRLSLDLHQWWNGSDPDEPADFLVPSLGAHDALTARALVLEGAGPPLAVCRVDAAVSTQRLTRGILEEVRDLGIDETGLLLTASHTHSGPANYLPSRYARLAAMDNYRPEAFERMVSACVGAIREAWTTRRPAAIGFARTVDAGPDGRPRVAENRRAEHWEAISPDDVDPTIELVEVVDRDDRDPIAVLCNYSVHPTVLREENLYFSSDLAGAIEREVSRRLGGPPVLLVQGAEGDIGPRGGSGGLRHVRRLARRFADAAVPALRELEPRATRVSIRTARGTRDFGDPFVLFAVGGRRAFLRADENAGLAAASFLLALPANVLFWAVGAWDARAAVHPTGTAGIRVDLSAYARTTTFPFHAVRIRTDAGDDVALVTVPGEAFHPMGERLRSLVEERGADRLIFCGLTNGALMYLPDPEEYERGGYEAMVTLFGPDTGPRAEASVRRCLEMVGYAGPGLPAVGPDRR